MNNLAQSQKEVVSVEGDDVSEFKPPANDFYSKAARLSIWSKSDKDDNENGIIDGNSSD